MRTEPLCRGVERGRNFTETADACRGAFEGLLQVRILLLDRCENDQDRRHTDENYTRRARARRLRLWRVDPAPTFLRWSWAIWRALDARLSASMFLLDSEADLLSAFRPKDQKTYQRPAGVTFPLFVRDYLAWQHPAGGYVFLVFAVPGGAPTGIVFDSNGGAGPTVPAMCDWCHQSTLGSGVGLLTAQLNSRKRVGVQVCTDLSCRQKLEEEAERAGRSVVPALEKLVARMGRFASEALQIDLSGERR